MADLIERLRRVDKPGYYRAAGEGHYIGSNTTYINPDGPEAATELARQAEEINRLREAMRGVEPYLDAIICYASTMGEHEPNRLAHAFRVALMDGTELACPKCGLEFKTLLHPFCQHKYCPPRERSAALSTVEANNAG